MELDWLYTFPLFQDSGRVEWRVDRKLQNQLAVLMLDRLETQDALSVAKSLVAEPRSENRPHLIALLSHFCYFAAYRIVQKLANFKQLPSDRCTCLQELFQVAFIKASYPETFFRSFNLDRIASLEAYIEARMYGIVRHEITKIPSLSTFGLSNLGLVSRSSRKRVKESLIHAGCTEPTLSLFIGVYQCLQEVKGATSLDVSEFVRQDFQAICDRYQSLAQPTFNLTGTEVQNILNEIGSSVRKYCDRSLLSLDSPYLYGDSDVTYLSDYIDDPRSYLGCETLEVREFRTYLAELFDSLQGRKRQIALLKYGLQLNQMQVGLELNRHQSQISHGSADILAYTIAAIANYLGIAAIASEQVARIKILVEENLNQHYQQLLDNLYATATNSISSGIESAELKRSLKQDLIERVEHYIGITLKPECAAVERISALVTRKNCKS